MSQKSAPSLFRNLRQLTVVVLLTAFSLANVSCEEEADNKLAKAQQCLDNLKDTDSDAAAYACQSKVDGLSSSESYVIRCSVGFFIGGVKASGILAAFQNYDDADKDAKAAILMANLSQPNNAPTQAKSTYAACKASGVASLEYIASVSLAGTLITGGSFTPGVDDPNTFLDDCINNSNSCDDATVGTVVTSMYDVYCVGDAAETQTCVEIKSAITAGGSDPSAVAIALYNLLKH